MKRLRFPLDFVLLCLRWYVAYPLSLRDLEEMVRERDVLVDHSTIDRILRTPLASGVMPLSDKS